MFSQSSLFLLPEVTDELYDGDGDGVMYLSVHYVTGHPVACPTAPSMKVCLMHIGSSALSSLCKCILHV